MIIPQGLLIVLLPHYILLEQSHLAGIIFALSGRLEIGFQYVNLFRKKSKRMAELKRINREAIPRALEKVDRYRLLQDPEQAESICRDILAIEPNHQEALVKLILCLTDQFKKGNSGKEANKLLSQLSDDYQREYYTGIIREREGKAALRREFPDSKHDAYEWFKEAMEAFERAMTLTSTENSDAILRWNACSRAIEKHHLTPRPKEEKRKLHQPLE